MPQAVRFAISLTLSDADHEWLKDKAEVDMELDEEVITEAIKRSKYMTVESTDILDY